jgi:hypothetical protein
MNIMAGENELLDMSMINYTPPEDEKDIVAETTTIVQEGIDNKGNKIIADDNSQENVGEKGNEKSQDNKDENSDSPANSDEVLFKALAESLKNRGLLSSLEKEVKTEEDLVEAFKEEIKKSEFADLNEVQKEYLEALKQGIPDTVIKEHINTRNIFESITDDVLDDDADVRRQVIVQERIATGMTPERAEREFKRIQAAGDEVEEARISRDNLKVREQQEYQLAIEREKQAAIAGEQQAAKQLEDLKQAVYKESTFLGSFKLDEGLKQKVYDSMVKVVGTTKDGLPLNTLMKHKLENPVDFETKLYYLYELTNGFKDISKFTNKATTIASRKLQSAIASTTFVKQNGSGPESGDPELVTPPDLKGFRVD